MEGVLYSTTVSEIAATKTLLLVPRNYGRHYKQQSIAPRANS